MFSNVDSDLCNDCSPTGRSLITGVVREQLQRRSNRTSRLTFKFAIIMEPYFQPCFSSHSSDVFIRKIPYWLVQAALPPIPAPSHRPVRHWRVASLPITVWARRPRNPPPYELAAP